MTDATIPLKVCRRCNTAKPLSAFRLDKRTGNHHSPCKVCTQEAERRRAAARLSGELPYVERAQKRCPRCENEKPISEFYKSTRAKDGHCVYCKPCQNGATHAGTIAYQHSPQGRAQRKLWQRSEVFKRKRARNHRSRTLRKKFGLTVEEYDRMLEAQGGVCLLCERENTYGRRLAVDHCHITGKVRGLLCTRCNAALGVFNDDPEILERAIQYLRSHQEKEKAA
jgi:hypothetical protein